MKQISPSFKHKKLKASALAARLHRQLLMICFLTLPAMGQAQTVCCFYDGDGDLYADPYSCIQWPCGISPSCAAADSFISSCGGGTYWDGSSSHGFIDTGDNCPSDYNPDQIDAICSISEEGIDRKLNVAITRARKQFVLIGNRELLESSPSYEFLIQYIGSLETSKTMEY